MLAKPTQDNPFAEMLDNLFALIAACCERCFGKVEKRVQQPAVVIHMGSSVGSVGFSAGGVYSSNYRAPYRASELD